MSSRKGNFLFFLAILDLGRRPLLFCSLLGFQSLHLEDKHSITELEEILFCISQMKNLSVKESWLVEGRAWDLERELGVMTTCQSADHCPACFSLLIYVMRIRKPYLLTICWNLIPIRYGDFLEWFPKMTM